MEFKVELLKENERDILRFNLSKNYDIDLNSEDQNGIKTLFFELISLSFEDDISFCLDSSKHEHDLFYDISVDYLKKLEEELKTIRSQIPDQLNDDPDSLLLKEEDGQ